LQSNGVIVAVRICNWFYIHVIPWRHGGRRYFLVRYDMSQKTTLCKSLGRDIDVEATTVSPCCVIVELEFDHL
jgi:hypothetical protein